MAGRLRRVVGGIAARGWVEYCAAVFFAASAFENYEHERWAALGVSLLSFLIMFGASTVKRRAYQRARRITEIDQATITATNVLPFHR